MASMRVLQPEALFLKRGLLGAIRSICPVTPPLRISYGDETIKPNPDHRGYRWRRLLVRPVLLA